MVSEVHELLVNHCPSMFSVHDLGGQAIYVSPSMKELFGHDPKDLIGTSAFAFIHPDDLEATMEQHDAGMTSTDPRWGICRFRTASGEYVWTRWIARVSRNAQTQEPQHIILAMHPMPEGHTTGGRVA